ncbi:carbohydrate sulfotransferase 3-like [Homarus americanus]|uniref:Carbohydrate sulfotransferase 3-like 4 n=1 Tax=Homarus americanus TaxID=6706 RepID=A0A8J5JUD1_HOMAM|nr:carbohydrate sulfotransferase 3-like [Homarus americanus]KAG7159369.1 Carbohydrate sulfotransferase 3-like 4 [Homarus americanus]
MALKIKLLKLFTLVAVVIVLHYFVLGIIMIYSYSEGGGLWTTEGTPNQSLSASLGGVRHRVPNTKDIAKGMTAEGNPEPASGNNNEENEEGEAREYPEGGGRLSPPATSSSPMFVLLLSSLARGGSTFMSELLSTIQRSIVYFEPLWYIEKMECIQDPLCATEYLLAAFTCTFKPDFEKWLMGRHGFFSYFNADVRVCLMMKDNKSKNECLNKLSLPEMCRAAPVRIMKVIRGRISWLKDILSDPKINLKIIHLTRDPRGSLNSISKFGPTWPHDPHERCSVMKDDMDAYDKLSPKFPSKLLQVHFEDLCLHPENAIGNIFKFLFGNSSLPTATQRYINLHMNTEVKPNAMGTIKKSKSEFEAWRYKIPERLLSKVEVEPVCLYTIHRMRHTVFGTLERVRNSSIPLILP